MNEYFTRYLSSPRSFSELHVCKNKLQFEINVISFYKGIMMSINMYFKVGDVEYSLGLPPEIIAVTKVLVESGYEELIEILLGDTRLVEKARLIDVIDFMLDSFENESDFLPYIYYVKYEWIQGSGNFCIGAGSSTGMKINGCRHTVEGGVNKCQLIKTWQDESGVWHEDKPIDIRDKEVIETDTDGDYGDLVIIKTKKPISFPKSLSELKEILLGAENITMIEKIFPC